MSANNPETYSDLSSLIQYSTDASAYRERPSGVSFPRDKEDIISLLKICRESGQALIARCAGTSLAGQVVGPGIVADVSCHMNSIIEINSEERWVRVQPGVVRDELNIALKPYGLFFSPETSTSDRCCIGGMTGNNSCGSHSLRYGSVRDHLLEARVLLADGSDIHLRALTPEEVTEKENLSSSEGMIYRGLRSLLGSAEARRVISDNFPDPALRRRNTGYALDSIAFSSCYDPKSVTPLNLCRLLAGSEGTLAFAYELKLALDPLPPVHKAVVCVHCSSIGEAFDVNMEALKFNPMAVELIDHNIFELSKRNIAQSRNRSFVEGDPQAMIVIEIAEISAELLQTRANEIISHLRSRGLGYAYPIVRGEGIKAVWALRKAGLGLLSGTPGSRRPVGVIEDTAVAPHLLKEFHADLRRQLSELGLECVYYAHIGSGELHLRPIIDLKEEDGRRLFRQAALAAAHTVRRYRGSLSGEHGDGRLRGEFIPIILGKEAFGMVKEVKRLFDPEGVLNRGKITDTPPMDTSLRAEKSNLSTTTYFDFSERKGWICAIEQCNGSGDCRRSQMFGGVMCPSFRAMRMESHSTRARANLLRELLIHPAHDSIFSQPEILETLATCLGCKGCKAECPSNVDMTRHKAEYLQHHYDEAGVPWRLNLLSNLTRIQRLGSVMPWLYNLIVSAPFTSRIIKSMMDFDPRRAVPRIASETLRSWLRHNPNHSGGRKVYLFADEFSEYEDVGTGIRFILLLRRLGYDPEIPLHTDSGRIDLSQGLLKRARKKAETNVKALAGLVSEETPLVGIEPSCILSFRDEYPDLVAPSLRDDAQRLASCTLLYDEFIMREADAGRITSESFTDRRADILLHGHCHQKAIVGIEASHRMLEIPKSYRCGVVAAGCCGMAGAFGYQRAHYELSMRIGEEALFPAVREAESDVIISAPGTSCRQQILHGTGRHALHPVDILYDALR